MEWRDLWWELKHDVRWFNVIAAAIGWAFAGLAGLWIFTAFNLAYGMVMS